jgi:hypothetical protein
LAIVTATSKTFPRAFRLAAVYYLGSLEKTIAQSQTEPTLLAGWTTANILDLVSPMHQKKQPLAYSVVRREHPALVSAAEARFGSWGMTLRAKGNLSAAQRGGHGLSYLSGSCKRRLPRQPQKVSRVTATWSIAKSALTSSALTSRGWLSLGLMPRSSGAPRSIAVKRGTASTWTIWKSQGDSVTRFPSSRRAAMRRLGW